MKPTLVRHLSARSFRNLVAVDLQPSPAVNVLFGDNGQGKTSLLEAIYLVATSRSFRTHRVKEAVMHGAEACHVRAVIDDGGVQRTQSVAVSSKEQVVRVDGDKPASLAAYAVQTPVVVFHPGELNLTMGAAALRRTLLDRVALFVDPGSLVVHRAYSRALKARQRALEQEGARGRSVEVWEQLLAEKGAALTVARRQACEHLADDAREAFRAMGPANLEMGAEYRAGGSTDPAEYKSRLEQDREQDLRRGAARFGPHRDDLLISLNGRPARGVASQGQHRLLTLGLKVAELRCVARGAGSGPILLLDDVSSELDASRTSAFFAMVGRYLDQVFLTTARRDVLTGLEAQLGATRLFEVIDGQVVLRAE